MISNEGFSDISDPKEKGHVLTASISSKKEERRF
jgi:hypothetical protein